MKFKENYINKLKDLPETLKQFIGLVIITILVILSFSILNGIFGQGDDLVKRMKLEEQRIAEEKKLSALISKLPSGILVSFDGTDHYKLTDEVYEQVCKVTKLMKLSLNGIKKKVNVLQVLRLVEIM